MSKIKFYKDSAKTQQVYPELDPEDITKFESLEDIENAFPNVSGEDTNLTLNHTVEAPMRLELAPSELEQETTSGKNIWNLNSTYTTETGSEYVLRDTNVNFPSGEYNLSLNCSSNSKVLFAFKNSEGKVQDIILEGTYNRTITFTDDKLKVAIYIYGSSKTTISNIMLRLSTTDNTYEPYTGGYPQPNPDFPSQVHSVSGDNEITVVNQNKLTAPSKSYTQTKNGMTLSYNTSNEHILTGTATTRTTIIVGNLLKYYTIQNNDYLHLCNNEIPTGIIQIVGVSSTNRQIFANTINSRNYILDLSPYVGQTLGHLQFYIVSGASVTNMRMTPMILNGVPTATNYIEHQEQSLPLNLPVENLISSSRRTGNLLYLNVSTTQADYRFKAGTYTFSYKDTNTCYLYYRTATTDTTTLGTNKTTTFTINEDFNLWLYRPDMTDDEVTNIQLEKGSKQNSYSEYGTTPLEYCKIGTYSDDFFKNDPSDPNYDSSLELDRWYLKKNVDKVVLDGSENFNELGEKCYKLSNFVNGYDDNPNIVHQIYCNNFTSQEETLIYRGVKQGIAILGGTTNSLYISNFEGAMTLQDFKSWLSTHNTIVYYVLATPQYILLSDTLQHQLDDIYNWVESYPGQTNISQINNDLPFIISARAMKDLSVIDKYPTENSEHLVESGGVYEVVNDINERIADIDTIRHNSKNVVYGSETGANIYLDDAYDTNLVELSVDGVCKQETTTGKNLLSEKTEYTANTYFYKDNGFEVKAGTTYTLSCDTNTAGLYVTRKDNNTNLFVAYNKTLLTFTPTEDTLVYFNFYFTGNKATQYQLEKGSTATSYEPYTGGQPSPSPDYPQPISTIENSLKITSCNKNLLPKSKNTFPKTFDELTIDMNNDGSYTITGTKTTDGYSTCYLQLPQNIIIPAGTYTVSDVRLQAYGTESGTYQNLSGTFTITEPYKFGSFYWATSIVKTYNEKIYPQLEIDTSATPYEQHLETQITANLPEGEFIGKISDTYKDTLKVEYNEEDGQYHLNLYKRVGRTKITNDNVNNLVESLNTSFKINGALIDKTKLGWKFAWTQDISLINTYHEIYLQNGAISGSYSSNFIKNYLILFNDKFTDLSITRELLIGTEIYIVLANPYVVDLGIVDITLFNGINHISNSEDANMSITYVKDINIVINKLTNAVVSLGSNV